MGMSNAVRVSIRVRPFNRREIAAQAELSVKVFKTHKNLFINSFEKRSTELNVRLFTTKKQKRLATMNVFGHMTRSVHFFTILKILGVFKLIYVHPPVLIHTLASNISWYPL